MTAGRPQVEFERLAGAAQLVEQLVAPPEELQDGFQPGEADERFATQVVAGCANSVQGASSPQDESSPPATPPAPAPAPTPAHHRARQGRVPVREPDENCGGGFGTNSLKRRHQYGDEVAPAGEAGTPRGFLNSSIACCPDVRPDHYRMHRDPVTKEMVPVLGPNGEKIHNCVEHFDRQRRAQIDDRYDVLEGVVGLSFSTTTPPEFRTVLTEDRQADWIEDLRVLAQKFCAKAMGVSLKELQSVSGYFAVFQPEGDSPDHHYHPQGYVQIMSADPRFVALVEREAQARGALPDPSDLSDLTPTGVEYRRAARETQAAAYGVQLEDIHQRLQVSLTPFTDRDSLQAAARRENRHFPGWRRPNASFGGLLYPRPKADEVEEQGGEGELEEDGLLQLAPAPLVQVPAVCVPKEIRTEQFMELLREEQVVAEELQRGREAGGEGQDSSCGPQGLDTVRRRVRAEMDKLEAMLANVASLRASVAVRCLARRLDEVRNHAAEEGHKLDPNQLPPELHALLTGEAELRVIERTIRLIMERAPSAWPVGLRLLDRLAAAREGGQPEDPSPLPLAACGLLAPGELSPAYAALKKALELSGSSADEALGRAPKAKPKVVTCYDLNDECRNPATWKHTHSARQPDGTYRGTQMCWCDRHKAIIAVEMPGGRWEPLRQKSASAEPEDGAAEEPLE